MNNTKITRERDRKYIKCSQCGVVWNVSKCSTEDEHRYVCMECEYRKAWRARYVKNKETG